MAVERRSERPQPFFARLISTPVLATAAAVVLTVGAVVWLAQRTSNESTGVATNSPKSSNPVATDSGNADVKSPAPNPIAPEGGEELAVNTPDRPDRLRYRPATRSGSTADFQVRPAAAISQNDPNHAFVNAPSKSVEVSLENDRGATRKISLPPVSFGAQNLVNNREPATYSANSRIW